MGQDAHGGGPGLSGKAGLRKGGIWCMSSGRRAPTWQGGPGPAGPLTGRLLCRHASPAGLLLTVVVALIYVVAVLYEE